jgi:hypothetical protein
MLANTACCLVMHQRHQLESAKALTSDLLHNML